MVDTVQYLRSSATPSTNFHVISPTVSVSINVFTSNKACCSN